MSEAVAPSVMFHVNVTDVPAYTARLLRKAYQQSARTQVLMGAHSSEHLSELLWSLNDADFIPHGIYDRERFEREASRTPIWLDHSTSPTALCPVIVNLSEHTVAPSDTLSKVIEVVGMDEPSVRLARQRWRHYLGLGWTPQKFERGRS